MKRRVFVLGAASASLLALAGCGFELRKPPNYAFRTLVVPGKTRLVAELRQAVIARGPFDIRVERKERTGSVFDFALPRRERRSRRRAAQQMPQNEKCRQRD